MDKYTAVRTEKLNVKNSFSEYECRHPNRRVDFQCGVKLVRCCTSFMYTNEVYVT